MLWSVVGVSLVYWYSNRIEMSLLYNDLDVETGYKITQILDESKTPYKISKDGSAIYAPKDSVPKLRLRIAGTGGLCVRNVGLEMFEQSGVTSATGFVQNVQYWRAVQGELSRSINSIDDIISSRVHIVPPKQSLFEEGQEPSAAVVIRVKPGTTLSVQQVRAIQRLVAASVPKMSEEKVSVADDRGCILAEESGANSNIDFAYQARISGLIESVVEKVAGKGNVQVVVHVEFDHDKTTEVAELYDNENPALRSSQKRSEQSKNHQAAHAVSIQEEVEPSQRQAGDVSNNQQEEEVANYEVSKTVRTSVKNPGKVSRLSVAVLMNSSQKQYSEDDVQGIVRLVKSSVGYNETRGDTVEVVCMPFMQQAIDIAEGIRDDVIVSPEDYDWKWIAGVLSVVVLVLLIGVYRVLSNKTEPTNQALQVVVPEVAPEPELSATDQDVLKLKATLNSIASQDPRKVATLIGHWLQEDGDGASEVGDE
jgi:flagellar M-ring protein FliF